FRKEGELIRSEMTDKITQLQVGVGKVAAGAVVLLVALIVLADALVVAVAEIIGEVPNTTENTGWAALIVGAFFAAVGAFLVRSGTTDLVPRNLTPDRTVDQVRRDTELAKDQVQ
ncbi:MAG: phage holin family protein, partial [Pseudomonadota bacterium]